MMVNRVYRFGKRRRRRRRPTDRHYRERCVSAVGGPNKEK